MTQDTRPDGLCRWIEKEQAGHDLAAGRVLARLLRELPPVDPAAAFVARAVAEAGRASRRRRMRTWLARSGVAAAMAAAVASAVAFAAGPFGGLVERGVTAAVSGIVWTALSVVAGLRWWDLAGRVGEATLGALLDPLPLAVMAVVEGLGVAAALAVRLLLRRPPAVAGLEGDGA